MKDFAVMIRREFWEHRSLWLAPLVTLGLMLLLALIATMTPGGHIQLGGGPRAAVELTGNASLVGMAGIAAPAMIVMLIVMAVYLLDCLYAERKDRSILFWKSLPVSDLKTVLSKLAAGWVLVPLWTLLLVWITFPVILALAHLKGGPVAEVASQVAAFAKEDSVAEAMGWMLSAWVLNLLWLAPVAVWLLLCSVWARRTPYLFAVLIPLGLMLIERTLFRSDYVADFLGHRLSPIAELWQGWSRPGLWLGLVAAALMVAVVVRLRRYRDDT